MYYAWLVHGGLILRGKYTQYVYTCTSIQMCTCIIKYASTVGPRLSESPLSEPSVIQTLFRILKYQEMIGFSTKPSNNEMPV